MDFESLITSYNKLNDLAAKGHLNRDQYLEELDKLRLQDSQGDWWKLAEGGSWQRWNGNSWESNLPPGLTGGSASSAGAGLSFSDSPTSGRDPEVKDGLVPPQNLFQLIVLLAKSVYKNIPRMLLSSLLIGILAWLGHAYFLVVVNNGYLKIGSWAANITALNLSNFNNVPAATFFWAVAGWILSYIFYNRLLGKGPVKYARDIFYMPLWISNGFKESGKQATVVFFAVACIGMLASIMIDNLYLLAILALALLVVLTSRFESISFLILQFAYSDLQKIFNKSKPVRRLNTNYLIIIISGLIFSVFFLLILPYKPYSAYMAAGLLLGASIFMAIRPKTVPMNIFFILYSTLAIYLFMTEGVLAHDGGWEEYGRDFSTWWSSQGRNEALAAGNLPGMAAALGSLLSQLGMSLADFSKLDESERQSILSQVRVQELERMRDQRHRQELWERQRKLEKEQAAADRSRRRWEWATWGAEKVKSVADKSIDVLAKITYPKGDAIRRKYRAASTMASGLGEAMAADPGKRLDHLVDAAGRAATDYVGDGIKNKRLQRGYELAQEGLAGAWQSGREAYREGEDITSAAARGMMEGTADKASGIIKDNLKGPKKRLYGIAEKGVRQGYQSFTEGGNLGDVIGAAGRGAANEGLNQAVDIGTGRVLDQFIPESGVVDVNTMQQHEWSIRTQDGHADQLVNDLRQDFTNGILNDVARKETQNIANTQGRNLLDWAFIK